MTNNIHYAFMIANGAIDETNFRNGGYATRLEDMLEGTGYHPRDWMQVQRWAYEELRSYVADLQKAMTKIKNRGGA